MPRRSRRYRAALDALDRNREYAPDEAIALVQARASARFDETVELHLQTSVDPRQADQQLRGVVTLPHGTGRQVRILVFAGPEGLALAEQAGADYAGGAELAERIQQGWIDFDVVLATPDQMRVVGRLGRILGPRGLMPSPKAGTIVNAADLPRIIDETRKGRVEYRVDRTANLHVPIGKASFEPPQLLDNMAAVMSATVQAKPSAVKGAFIRSVSLASTMGPGIAVDVSQAASLRSEA